MASFVSLEDLVGSYDILVTITTYNQEKYLSEAIDSVLNQSLQTHEINIIDGSHPGC